MPLSPKDVKISNTTSLLTSESSDLSGDEIASVKKTRTKKQQSINDSISSNYENEKKPKSTKVSTSKLKDIDEFQMTETSDLMENKTKHPTTTIRFSVNENTQNHSQHQQKYNKYSSHKNNENCDVYIELEELHYSETPIFSSISNQMSSISNHYEWKIKTRWIKFEQTIDPQTHIWSKPFVGSLIYQNLILLKSKMQYASIILNSRENTFERIVEEVLLDLINRGQLEKDKKDMLKSILLSQHRNNLTLSGAMSGISKRVSAIFPTSHSKTRKFSFVTSNDALGKDVSVAGGVGDHSHGQIIKKGSVNKFHTNTFHRNLSTTGISTNPNESVKFFVASSNTLENSAENVNAAKGHLNLNNSVMSISAPINHKTSPFYQFRHSLKAHHHHYGHHTASDTSLNRVEAFVIMVGVADFLGLKLFPLVY
jgi:hypothetical protein